MTEVEAQEAIARVKPICSDDMGAFKGCDIVIEGTLGEDYASRLCDTHLLLFRLHYEQLSVRISISRSACLRAWTIRSRQRFSLRQTHRLFQSQRYHEFCVQQHILTKICTSVSVCYCVSLKIAATTNRPEKVIGMHFMNPVPVMKLVEIIPGIATSKETLDTTVSLAAEMGKVACYWFLVLMRIMESGVEYTV